MLIIFDYGPRRERSPARHGWCGGYDDCTLSEWVGAVGKLRLRASRECSIRTVPSQPRVNNSEAAGLFNGFAARRKISTSDSEGNFTRRRLELRCHLRK